nr:MAG TPA: hypothetical protein [Caudoviricetes sp.]
MLTSFSIMLPPYPEPLPVLRVFPLITYIL